jgi:acyl dehydratase
MTVADSTDPAQAQVGDELPPFVRETGLANWNRFAAVNDEFIPIHMDDEAGRAAGYDGAFGMGNLQWSYLHNLLREWLGESGSIESVSCQFRSVNTKGMIVTARGRVVGAETVDSAAAPAAPTVPTVPTPAVGDPDRALRRLTVEIWTEDQSGAILAPGRATVLVR